MSHMKVCKIDDPRIAGYTNRTRSGSTQVFYTGNDERDWDRYRKEGGGRKHNVTMHDKPDTIRITPPEKHYYAELIEGEWWWVNGCEECNGRPRDCVKSYIECEKHDVCNHCGIERKKLDHAPWGKKDGWICQPCAQIAHDIEKEQALADMPEHHDEWHYHDLHDITCPYCNYKFSDSWEYANADEEEQECPRCDNVFTVTAVQSLTFDCSRIEQPKCGDTENEKGHNTG